MPKLKAGAKPETAEKLSVEQKFTCIRDGKKRTVYIVGTSRAINDFYARKVPSTTGLRPMLLSVDTKSGNSYYTSSLLNAELQLKSKRDAIVVLLKRPPLDMEEKFQRIHTSNIAAIRAKFDRAEAFVDLNSILLTDRELASQGISTYAELAAFIQADYTHNATAAVKREKLNAIFKALDIKSDPQSLATLDEISLDYFIKSYSKRLQEQAENRAAADAPDDAIFQKRSELNALYGALGTLPNDSLLYNLTAEQLDGLITLNKERVAEKRAADKWALAAVAAEEERALAAEAAYDTFDAEEDYREMVSKHAEIHNIELPEDFDFMALADLREFKSEIDEAVVARTNQVSAEAAPSTDDESDEATDAHQAAAAMLDENGDEVVAHDSLLTKEKVAESFEKIDEDEIESAKQDEADVARELAEQFYHAQDASSLFGHSQKAKAIHPEAIKQLDASL